MKTSRNDGEYKWAFAEISQLIQKALWIGKTEIAIVLLPSSLPDNLTKCLLKYHEFKGRYRHNVEYFFDGILYISAGQTNLLQVYKI